MTKEKHPKYDWWMSVRDHECFDSPEGRRRRICDIMYGVIELFHFPKTHQRLIQARYKTKVREGLKDVGYRLSHRLKIDGPRASARYFTPHVRSVKGVIWHNTARCFKKVRRHTVREYGRRHALIVSPRYDRHYRKYGPLGG